MDFPRKAVTNSPPVYIYLSIIVSLYFSFCFPNIREAEEKQAINIISTKGQEKEQAIQFFQCIQWHISEGEDAVKLEGSLGGLVLWVSHTEQLNPMQARGARTLCPPHQNHGLSS